MRRRVEPPHKCSIRGAEICFSVVEAIMIGVVGKQAGWNVDNQVVHLHILLGLSFAVCQGPDSIKGVAIVVGIPFVLF